MSEEAAETTEASGSTSTDVKPLKRKYNKGGPQSDKKPPMPVYCKYNILKMLKENHCLIFDEGQLLAKAFPRNSRYTLDDIKNFISKTAQKSQTIVEKNNKSQEFKRATELIKSIEQRSPFSERTLDVALSLKTIADVFDYNEDEKEVDVRMLYQTLTNLSLGFPTSHMDDVTNEFLHSLYKEFLEQCDSKQFRADVEKYQRFFQSTQSLREDRPDVKHPTEHSSIELAVKSTLNSSAINPLNLPYSFLHKPKDSM